MSHEREPAVYILASGRHGTLYIGVTSDLLARVHQHREGLIPGFTRRYGIKRLVHFEMFESMGEAIQREKRLKEWRRAWKIQLIEAKNPYWDDLAIGLGLTRLPD
jgi:putative endonuclease